MPDKRTVGVIGLGIIGTQVAGHLRNAGFAVSVWNRTPKQEPGFLASPAAVAEACEVIQFFVADVHAVHEVLDAMGDALQSRHTIVCSATIGPEGVLEVAKRVQERGARFLDAPFTGSKAAAGNHALVYYIGGNDETFAVAKPVLEASSKAIVRMGKIGQAALVKVLTNVINAATIEALAETLAVLKAEGMAPEIMTAALEHHGIRSPMIDMKLPGMLAGDYAPHFSLKHMLKDVKLSLALGAKSDLDLPVTKATAEAMEEGMGKGWADLDFTSVLKRY
ncbi:TPA: hypothetical protein DDW35_05805 [Candidatus Sumerlaeota bacterium]|nr:hypothetical protein [Candidatus Sumerlaeota bacterium]